MNELDIAWAAGLFEGEGCFYEVHPTKQSLVYLGMTIEMTDPPILERFLAVLQAHDVATTTRITSRWRGNVKHSRQYAIKVTGTQAEAAYALMHPHLGDRRRAKADSILAKRSTMLEEMSEIRTCACGTEFAVPIRGQKKAWCSSACLRTHHAQTEHGRELAQARNRRHRERKRLGLVGAA